jgi:glucan phosphoethanolaminetransferase (alkaline phosphatase superfamily)
MKPIYGIGHPILLKQVNSIGNRQGAIYQKGNRMHLNEEEIIKKYAVIRKLTLITYIVIFIAVPILLITFLLTGEESFLRKCVTTLSFILFGASAFVLLVVRRCPNCHHWFSRNVFDPKNCPYCHVRLR